MGLNLGLLRFVCLKKYAAVSNTNEYLPFENCKNAKRPNREGDASIGNMQGATTCFKALCCQKKLSLHEL